MSMDDRLCIATGAKNGIFPVDDVTLEYCKDRCQREPRIFQETDADTMMKPL